MSRIAQLEKQNLAATKKQMDRDIADSNKIYEGQSDNVKSKYETQIDLLGQQYDELERTNEVQKYINYRDVAENNASLGLTDAGLNRTQQTAVQLSASNNAAKIARDRQNMVNSLTQETNALLTEIENNRIASESSIRKGYEQQAHNSAVSQYNAEQSAAAARYKAQLAAQQNAANARNKAYNTLVNYLIEKDADLKTAAAKIKLFHENYGVGSSSELASLLRYAGITANDYYAYVNPNYINPEAIDLSGAPKLPINPWAKK